MLLVRDGLRFWQENQIKYDCENLDKFPNEKRSYYQYDTTNNGDDASSDNPQVAITRMLSRVSVDDECYHTNKIKLAELENQCFSILITFESNDNKKENQTSENCETNHEHDSSMQHDTKRINMIDEEKMRILGTSKKTAVNTNIDHLMKCDHIPYSMHVALMREDCTSRPLWK